MNSEQERLIRLIMTQILIFKKQYILKLEMLRIYEGILTVTHFQTNDALPSYRAVARWGRIFLHRGGLDLIAK